MRSNTIWMRERRVSWLMAIGCLVSITACDNEPEGPPDAGPCTPGTRGCECRSDGTCDTYAGLPMTCMDGVCIETELPEPGELNGECSATIPCGTYNGEQLTCIDGTCQLSDCLSGTTNCPCGVYGACDDADARCEEAYCRLQDCTPGTAGCVCDSTGACEGGLECDDGYCSLGARMELVVSSPDVRSCEVLLADPDEAIGTVLYASSVTGRDDRQGDRFAVAWFSNTDAAFAPGALKIELASPTASAANLVVVESTCYDRLGQEVAGAEVGLGD